MANNSILSFLGGAAVGAFISGVTKIIAQAIKDRRDHRTSQEARVRSVYALCARYLEEARATVSYYALGASNAHEQEPQLHEFRRQVFSISKRVGAARTRLALLEDNDVLREEGSDLVSAFDKLVQTALACDGTAPALVALVAAVDKLRWDLNAFLMRVAAVRANERRLHRSWWPVRLFGPPSRSVARATSGDR